jgi:hypothetical protein
MIEVKRHRKRLGTWRLPETLIMRCSPRIFDRASLEDRHPEARAPPYLGARLEG